jgi:hypothetical protein
MGKAVLLLALLLSGAALNAETYMLLVESSLDGAEDPGSPAITEGLMSAMFEAGQVTFDCGPYRPQADWQNLQFREPLEIAREGGAHYLATVRLAVRSLPAEPLPADSPPAETVRLPAFALQARFQLWDPRSGARLGEGELELDNRGREKELPYEALLFRAGELAAGQLRGIAGGR